MVTASSVSVPPKPPTARPPKSWPQKFEAAYAMKLTVAQARKVVSDIYEGLHGDQLYHATTKKFLNEWLVGKHVEMSAGSYKRYKNAEDKLIAFLGGARAERDIAYVHKRDITATELSPATDKTDRKILRVAFRQAVVDGMRLGNPASAVSTLDDIGPGQKFRSLISANIPSAPQHACVSR